MVFNVGRPLIFGLTFKLVEQLTGIFTQNINQYVKATAVGHADNNFFRPVGAATLDHGVHHGNQAFAALKTKALGAGKFRTQRFF